MRLCKLLQSRSNIDPVVGIFDLTGKIARYVYYNELDGLIDDLTHLKWLIEQERAKPSTGDNFLVSGRADGRIELLCKHGIGHTSELLSKANGLKWDDRYSGVHGCDGCCGSPGFQQAEQHLVGQVKKHRQPPVALLDNMEPMKDEFIEGYGHGV